jgi:hypothetical protein
MATQNSVSLWNPALTGAKIRRRPDSTQTELAFESVFGQQVAG